MAFGNIGTFYLPDTATTAGASLWGTNVRKLITATGTATNTTQTNHSTGGAVTRTVRPYASSTTDADQSLFGWAIQGSDMNSVAGALRFFPAGNHTATFKMNQSTAVSVSATVTMYVYRIGPAASRTPTLLGSNPATVTVPATGSDVTVAVTVALSEVVFDVDETIQYSFEVNCAGLAVTGRILAVFTGNFNGVDARVDTPTLGVRAETTGSASGTGAATAAGGLVLGATGAASGVGAAAGTGAASAATTGSSAGVGTAAAQGASTATTTGTAAGSASAAGQASIVLGATGTVTVGGGGGTTVTRPIYVFDD